MSAHQHFSAVLERLKYFFPAPTSDPVMDGYFVHTISQFLDRLDRLKGKAPLLARGDYESFAESAPRTFPEEMASIEQVTEWLADYCQGMMIWAHPNCQSQVVPPPTISSITAVLASALYNPNLIQDEYSFRFADAETQAIRLTSDLVGYDADRSGGIFTFGGTGTILYGCKLALERMLKGRGMREGIRRELKIVASRSAHYARLNVAAWLGLLSRQPDQMPYLYQHGHYHPGSFTLECSRSGGSALSALANMRLLGKQGYRVMIGHVVEMAEMLRRALEPWPFVKVLNERNYGPVTVFRVYPGDIEAGAAHDRELRDPKFSSQLAYHNAYNRQLSEMIFKRAMRGQGVLLSWTGGYQYPDYPDGVPLAALKSFIMSPWTDQKAIDAVVEQILELRAVLEKRDPEGPNSRTPGQRAA